jgi:tRNA-modifying protein YgfZ
LTDIDLKAYESAQERAVYFDLSSYGKIAVTGPDAATFLHNLSTNDIKNLPIGGGCEAFLCNARARTLAYLLISHWPDEPPKVPYFMLDMVPSLREKVAQHLNKYLISERAEIVDRSDQLALLRLVGPKTEAILSELFRFDFPDLPAMHHVKLEHVLIRRHTLLGLPGFDVFCATEQVPKFIDDLKAAGVELAPMQVHEILRIEAGTPEYGKEMDDDRFVAEVGRTAQAISYTKGCYLGQEPIVMARDRGQVNRTLMGVTFADSMDPCVPFSKLFVGETEVGLVTSSAWSPRFKQVLALAYLRRGTQQPGTEVVCDGRKGVLAGLPFQL